MSKYTHEMAVLEHYRWTQKRKEDREKEKERKKQEHVEAAIANRQKGRPAVYWVRIEAPCRGCLKIAMDVEKMLIGRGCKFEISSNREMLARIRRGIYKSISKNPADAEGD